LGRWGGCVGLVCMVCVMDVWVEWVDGVGVLSWCLVRVCVELVEGCVGWVCRAGEGLVGMCVGWLGWLRWVCG
jgi:hypothetical protein